MTLAACNALAQEIYRGVESHNSNYSFVAAITLVVSMLLLLMQRGYSRAWWSLLAAAIASVVVIAYHWAPDAERVVTVVSPTALRVEAVSRGGAPTGEGDLFGVANVTCHVDRVERCNSEGEECRTFYAARLMRGDDELVPPEGREYEIEPEARGRCAELARYGIRAR